MTTPRLKTKNFAVIIQVVAYLQILYVRDYSKIGRNEKCPCGSGFKFKKCCAK